MNIGLCLITDNDRIINFFGRGKSNALPMDVLNRGYFEGKQSKVFQSSFRVISDSSKYDLELFCLERARDCEIYIIFVDEKFVHLVYDLRFSFFIVKFDNALTRMNLQNFFQSTTARALKNISQLYSRMSDRADLCLVRLPIRNFKSKNLENMCDVFLNSSLSADFGNLLDMNLKLLRMRVRPRRKSTYSMLYIVDDSSRFFRLGHERHARFETGGDHEIYCEINGKFRFGVKIDEYLHYNVSETENDRTTISGDFANCHGKICKVENKQTHLNMFSNDYF